MGQTSCTESEIWLVAADYVSVWNVGPLRSALYWQVGNDLETIRRPDAVERR